MGLRLLHHLGRFENHTLCSEICQSKRSPWDFGLHTQRWGDDTASCVATPLGYCIHCTHNHSCEKGQSEGSCSMQWQKHYCLTNRYLSNTLLLTCKLCETRTIFWFCVCAAPSTMGNWSMTQAPRHDYNKHNNNTVRRKQLFPALFTRLLVWIAKELQHPGYWTQHVSGTG